MFHIVFDIETTGLDVTKDSPIQIAYDVLDWQSDGKPSIERDAFIINPGANKLPLPKKITEITGITTDQVVADGTSASGAAERWSKLIWTFQPVTLVGYNAINFDFMMTWNWLHRMIPGRFKFPPVMGIIDVMHMASALFRTKKWFKLKDSATKLGIPFEEEKLHDALYDVHLTSLVYKALLKRIGQG